MKRYLREAAVTHQQASSQGLALFQKDGRIILYDPNGMLKALQERNPEEQSYTEMDAALANSIYGYIELADVPDGQAWGSEMVRQSAARKGYGPFMYDIAMSMAGSIVSDRDKVSPAAERIWKTYQQRGDITKRPLDDITDPKTPSEEDDAAVFATGHEDLNFAYSGAQTNVEALQSNHQKFLKDSAAVLGDSSLADDALESAADSFFRKMY